MDILDPKTPTGADGANTPPTPPEVATDAAGDYDAEGREIRYTLAGHFAKREIEKRRALAASGVDRYDPQAARFDALFLAMPGRHTPEGLHEAATQLMLLALENSADEVTEIEDRFANDTDKAIIATRAALELCEAALTEIRAKATEAAKHEYDRHRQVAAAIKAVGVSF